MKPAPGTWLWLLRNEMRLSWRGASGSHLKVLSAFGALLWLLMHWGAWTALPAMRGLIDGMRAAPMVPGALFWMLASLMLSQAILHSVNAFVTRGDLDLLLSSPMPQRDIFLVRALSIALSAALLPGFALLPLAHVGPLRGYPGFIAIYPVLAAAALGCAAAGLAIMMALVRLLGARRARTAGQVIGACSGAAFFLAFQLPRALTEAQKASLVLWLKNGAFSGGALGPASPLWWPVRAMYGEPLPLLAVAAAGAGLFWLAVNIAYRSFVSGTQESVSGGTTAAAAAGAGGPVFRPGLSRVLLLKEWRLILRDMQVISQSLLQLLYLAPMIFMGFKSGPGNFMLVPGLVAAAGMLTGSLAWITVNAEDAPELISSSPVPLPRVLWLKAAAAVLPVLCLLLPLAAWWARRGPAAAATLLFCGAGAMLSAALIQAWSPRRARRGDLKNRLKAGGPAGFIELFSTLSWTIMAALIPGKPAWTPLAAMAIATALLSAWGAGSAAREETWGGAVRQGPGGHLPA